MEEQLFDMLPSADFDGEADEPNSPTDNEPYTS